MYPAREPHVRTRRVTLPGGLTLRVAEAGASTAPPVLLLHGWGASVYMWRDWFAPLAGAGHRVVAVDLPGHGLSDKPTTRGAYTTDALVSVLRQLMDAEQLDGAGVVAQSMGGSIALELALADRSPVARLALVNPAAFGRVPIQPLARMVSPAVVDVVLGRLVPRWIVAGAHRRAYADGSRVSPRDVDEYWAPSQFPGYARAMRLLLHEFTWSRPPADEMARRVSMLAHPPLVLLGGVDRLVHDAAPYAATVRRLGAPVTIVEHAAGGHAMNEEEPGVVLAHVLPFLR
jgi:pimeloyl-ACP methyl ester carboxylesterase